jgi:hypothetical protein
MTGANRLFKDCTMSLENFHEPTPKDASSANEKPLQLAGDFEKCPATPQEWADRGIDGALKEDTDLLGDVARQRIHDEVMGIIINRIKNPGGDC